MEYYKDRVLVEKEELVNKITKLENFLNLATTETKEIKLLKEQLDIMYSYVSILNKRIANWS